MLTYPGGGGGGGGGGETIEGIVQDKLRTFVLMNYQVKSGNDAGCVIVFCF